MTIRRIRPAAACCLLVLAVLLLGAASARAAGNANLRNQRLTASFGARGLVALEFAGRRVVVSGDEFGVSINGQGHESASLPAPTRLLSKDKVTYTWAAGDYRVNVVYELQPAWGFVSKQLSVSSPNQAAFRVDEVTVFRGTLGEPIAGRYVPKSARATLGTGDYGVCLRLHDRRGLLVLVQNPFLEVSPDAGAAETGPGESRAFGLRYKPELEWRSADGPFVADRGLIGPYRATGRTLPARMQPEWSLAGDAAPGMDEAEVAAFTEMVRAFMMAKPARPVNVLVPWCLNDYQIDIATPEGRAEYKRILDSGAALGADYAIFAPTNSDLAKREDSLDDWSWENLLWLGFGQKIRRNEWDVKTGPVPASVQEMLDYARAKKVKLLAYVYPVVPFSQNRAWLVSPKDKPQRQYASLGVRAFQDWLIEALVAFHDRFDLGGYSFDHTFLTYPGTSRYAQWAGWRRVMEELRRRVPDIVIDGRQAYHLYGPWGWLAGSYPHPTFHDEQPESFIPFPDLHFDRVSADRERFTAYRYRNYEFAPSELVPGFITHQTSRGDDTGEMPEKKTDKGIMLLPFRERDWDYLGWRYSLLSSIAVAGLNNVLDLIPARDPAEYGAFSAADRQWFRRWIDWTDANKEYLRNTRTILGQPAIGKVDGTAALVNGRGYIFLFNPNGRRLDAELSLDASIGLTVPPARGRGEVPRFVLRELYPQEGRLIGGAQGALAAGDKVTLPMDGGSALVLELQPAPVGPAPVLFNVQGQAAVKGDVLDLTNVRGEMGASVTALVTLPAEQGRAVKSVAVNGRPLAAPAPVSSGDGALVLPVTIPFDGAPFAHYQQIGAYDPAFAGGRWTGQFTVPARVFQQLAARQKAWPIPWTSDDYRTTWLAPQRLLLFVQIAEPDDRWEAALRIDGKTVELKKAYTAVRVERRTFVGFYADLSLLAPEVVHSIELDLPTLKPGQLQGVFFENVETEYTDRVRTPTKQ